MKKALIAAIALVAVYAVIATADTLGVEPTCAEAVALDEEGTAFRYTGSGGEEKTFEFSDSVTRITGLRDDEKVGFSYTAGRLTGILYEQEFYLLDESRRSEIRLLEAQRAGAGQVGMKPTQKPLPVRCPAPD